MVNWLKAMERKVTVTKYQILSFKWIWTIIKNKHTSLLWLKSSLSFLDFKFNLFNWGGGGKGMGAAWISSSIFSSGAGGGKRMGAVRMAIGTGGTVMNTIAHKRWLPQQET